VFVFSFNIIIIISVSDKVDIVVAVDTVAVVDMGSGGDIEAVVDKKDMSVHLIDS
jgi:hypothetical protein